MSDDGAIADLQMRLTYQEDDIKMLNLALIRQQDEIESLRKKIARLTDTLETLTAQGAPASADERPPHY